MGRSRVVTTSGDREQGEGLNCLRGRGGNWLELLFNNAILLPPLLHVARVIDRREHTIRKLGLDDTRLDLVRRGGLSANRRRWLRDGNWTNARTTDWRPN